MEQRGGDDQHRHVDQAGDAHGDAHVDALEAQQPLALAVVARRDAPLRQRRVQVDDVRHDRGAEDAGRQQHRVRALEAGDEALGGLAGVEADAQRVVEEAEDDEPEQAGDDGLEAPVALGLQPEDREGDDGGDEPGLEERHVEEQVQRDGGADELGEVGRHGDQLGLDPQPPRDRPREVIAAQLGEVAPGRDADLGREVLDQHRHEVGAEQHPQQQVAVLGAAGDVRGEVAGVDVGDAGDEGRPEQGEGAAQAPARLQLLQSTRRRKRDGGVGHAATWARMARASAPPSTWTSSPKRAKVGPSNGCLSMTSKSSPGAMPRSAR